MNEQPNQPADTAVDADRAAEAARRINHARNVAAYQRAVADDRFFRAKLAANIQTLIAELEATA